MKNKKKRAQDRSATYWVLGLIGLLVVIVVAVVILNPGGQPAAASPELLGTEIPVPSADHIANTTNPGPYPSDPPAGGRHFATDFKAGFFEESDVASLPQHPEGYLVHNLEHGYIIFWYNCAAPGAPACEDLKSSIRSVMDANGNLKVIAFPWPSIDVPLVMTSWGRLLKFPTLDTDLMNQFVRTNRNQAPEPMAD